LVTLLVATQSVPLRLPTLVAAGEPTALR